MTESQTEIQKDPKQYPLIRNLQYSPIKQDDAQYVVLWDPTGLTAEKLVLPLNYFYLFQFFDGEHSLDEIGVEYLKKFGEFFMPDRLSRLVADLEAKLFLEGNSYEEAKAAAVSAYREASIRKAAFAGKSYEDDKGKLQLELESFFASREGPGSTPSANNGKKIKAIVAPHYEPKQGGPLYAWAYKELKEAATPDLFIILGTCHAGLEHGFATTDKTFETPLGPVQVHRGILDRVLQLAGPTFFEEDFRHQHEHSIEFQLPFLQFTAGSAKSISIVPILCSFPPAWVLDSEFRELGNKVDGFIQALRDAITSSGQEVCVVASADLAHIGLRYGDRNPPTDFSFHRCMQTDLQMLKHVENLEPEAFAEFIHKEEDHRRICGFSPIFTMLKLIQAEKGEVLRYDRGITDQFNSTVTYASMAFY